MTLPSVPPSSYTSGFSEPSLLGSGAFKKVKAVTLEQNNNRVEDLPACVYQFGNCCAVRATLVLSIVYISCLRPASSNAEYDIFLTIMTSKSDEIRHDRSD